MSTKNKPVIGVCPLVDYGRQSLWMLPGYFEGIEQAGGLPLMLPLTRDEDALEQALTMCDGLLLTGGQDVSPELYDCPEDSRGAVGEVSDARDAQERVLLKLAMQWDLPVLGICRGIQIMNVALGGTLWQDLPTQHDEGVEHCGKAPHGVATHNVEVLKNTPLAYCVGTGELEVNSYHHQALREVAPELQVMAISEDGLVEAVCHPEMRFMWAVQWHPELSFKTDASSRAIFETFVGASIHQTLATQELIWV